MATGNDIPLNISLDISELKAQLASIPDITKKEATQMVAELSKSYKAATKSATDSVKGVGKASKDAAQEADKAWKESSDGLLELGDLAGIPKDKIDKLSKGLAALTNPLTATAVAVGLGTVALAAMGAGMVGIVLQANELIKQLEPLKDLQGFAVLPKEAVDSIKNVSAGFDALGSVGKELIVRVAAELAPAIEQVTFVLVKFGLAALDTFDSLSAGGGILKTLATFMTKELLQSFLKPIDVFVDIITLMGALADKVGAKGLSASLIDVTARWENFSSEVANNILSGAISTIGEGFGRLDQITGDYDSRAKALVGTQRRLAEATKDTGEALKQLNEDLHSSEAAGIAGRKAYDDVITALNKLEQADKQAAHEKEGQLLAAHEAALQEIEDLKTIALAQAETASSRENVETEALNAMRAENERYAFDIAQLQEQMTDKAAREAQKQADDLARAHEKAQQDIASGIGAAQGGLASIIGAIGGPVAGAIASLVLNFGDVTKKLGEELMNLPDILKNIPAQAVDLVKTILTDVVPALIQSLPDIVTGILDAVPDLITAIVEAVPLIVQAIIYNVPNIIQALIEGIPQIIVALVGAVPQLLIALSQVILDSVKAAWEWITSGGIKALATALWDTLKGLFQDLGRIIGAAFLDLIGKHKAADELRNGVAGSTDVNSAVSAANSAISSLNDSPGVIQAGPDGFAARFAPGDYIAASRTREGLDRMTHNNTQSDPMVQPITVNWTDGAKTFDSFMGRHLAQNNRTTRAIYSSKRTGR